MRVRAEFTTEPFVGEGEMPEHVTHAAALLTEAGLDPDLGPFGTSVEGDDRVLVPALTDVLAAALASGATRVTLQLERLDAGTPGSSAVHEGSHAQASQTNRKTDP